MYWFLLFLGVAVVWAIVVALLARRLWGQGRALARELAAAQSKLEAAQRVPTSSSGHSEQDAGARA